MTKKIADNIPVRMGQRVSRPSIGPILAGTAPTTTARYTRKPPQVSHDTKPPRHKKKRRTAQPPRTSTSGERLHIPQPEHFPINTTAKGMRFQPTPPPPPVPGLTYQGATLPDSQNPPINTTAKGMEFPSSPRRLKPSELPAGMWELFRNPRLLMDHLKQIGRAPREGILASPARRTNVKFDNLLDQIDTIPTTDKSRGTDAAVGLQIPSLGVRPHGPRLRQLSDTEQPPNFLDFVLNPQRAYLDQLPATGRTPQQGVRSSPTRRSPYSELRKMLEIPNEGTPPVSLSQPEPPTQSSR